MGDLAATILRSHREGERGSAATLGRDRHAISKKRRRVAEQARKSEEHRATRTVKLRCKCVAVS